LLAFLVTEDAKKNYGFSVCDDLQIAVTNDSFAGTSIININIKCLTVDLVALNIIILDFLQ
jgi:hypothetical protein